MNAFDRRSVLKAGLAGLSTTLLLAEAERALADDLSMSWASINPGSFTTFIMEFMRKRGLDKKHGIALPAPIVYTSVGSYYNDFVVGNYDMCMGSWDTFASRQQGGVPLRFLCAFTTGSMVNIIVPANGAKTLQDLKGKTLAATTATGTYRVMRALLKDYAGFNLEQEVKVQNVDNPAVAVTLVMVDRADAVLVWEPNTSMALQKAPGTRVLYSAEDDYRKKTGLDLPYFGVALRNEVLARSPDLAPRLDAAFHDSVAGIVADVDAAVDLVGTAGGLDPEIMRLAIKSGRLQFKHISMREEKGRELVKAASTMLIENKLLNRSLGDDFFAI